MMNPEKFLLEFESKRTRWYWHVSSNTYAKFTIISDDSPIMLVVGFSNRDEMLEDLSRHPETPTPKFGKDRYLAMTEGGK